METRLSIRQNKTVIALTVLLVAIVTLGIGQAGWTDGLDNVFFIGMGAVFIGLLISRSLLPGPIAHLFSLIIGVAWAFWVVSQQLPQQLPWRLRWENMVGRLTNWYQVAVEGGVNYDNLMFVLQMGLIVWGISYLTAWFVFRSGKIWSAVIPGGLVLLINLYYAPEDLTLWFIAYLLISMILIVRFNLYQQELRWRANQVYFRSDIGFDFLRNGILFSIIIIALAWFAPAIDETQTIKVFGVVDREWRDVQENWNRMFASLNYRPDPLSGANSFGQTLNLGGPRQLTAEPVMMVDAPGGRYWRAAVYDEYNGFGWTSNDREEVVFKSNQKVDDLPFYRARQPFTQTYTMFRDGATVLYAAASPISVDRSGLGKTSSVGSHEIRNDAHSYWLGQRGPWIQELTYLESDRRLQAEETYQVVSMFSVARKEDLRNDGAQYPDWIAERYLQLPDNVPDSVLNLAAEITQNADNNFDKASAIEDYLRTNIAYNESIQPPPPGKDKVEYILFEAKEAYCDYYATSMIVMLRSQGIPARLAAGFARGQVETLDDNEQVYFVQNKHAHSWVEVFFPQYGWIEFEPTAAQPVITRRTDEAELPDLSEQEDLNDRPEDDDFDSRLDRLEDIEDLGPEDDTAPPVLSINLPFWGEVSAPMNTLRNIGFGSIIVVLMLGSVSLYSRRNKDKKIKNLPTVSGIYFAMLKLSALMGLKSQAGQTPYEHANQVAEAVPTVKPEIELVTDEYVRRRFSRAYTSPTEIKEQLLQAWQKMRPAFYKATFQKRNPFRNFRLPFRW